MEDLYKADLLLDNIFIFDEYGDMEKANLEVKNEPLDWSFSPNKDEEWTYMLNRFTYLDLLTRVHKKSHDDKYLNKAKELIENWIDNVKLIPSNMTRTLDTGIRVYHIIKFLSDNNIDDEKFKIKVKKSIYDQIEYLRNHYIDKYDLSNWGLIQLISVAVASIYYNDQKLYDKSIKKINDTLSIQFIDNSSIHWERCIGYHNFLLQWILRLSQFQKNNGKVITFANIIRKIAETTLITTDLKGRQLNNGDSDLTNTDILIDTYYDIFNEKLNVENHKLFKNYGLYIEKKKETLLSIYNTSMSSNHTHGDFTHFNYQNDGIEILDGGRYTYKESDERKYFKLFAHNNLIIDGNSSMGYISSWETSKYPITNPIYVNKKRNTYIETSYYDEIRKIYVKRNIFYLEDGDIIVFDYVNSYGTHQVKMNLLENGLDYNNFKINKKFVKRDALYSKEYNSLERCNEIIVNETFKDTYTQCMIIGDISKYEFINVTRDSKNLSDKIAIAVKSDKAIYVNIFEEIIESPRVLCVDDIKFHAKALTIYGKNDLEIYR